MNDSLIHTSIVFFTFSLCRWQGTLSRSLSRYTKHKNIIIIIIIIIIIVVVVVVVVVVFVVVVDDDARNVNKE